MPPQPDHQQGQNKEVKKQKFKMFVRNVSNLNFGKNPALFTSSQMQPVSAKKAKQSGVRATGGEGAGGEETTGGSSLVDLCDYLQKHQLAINIE